MKPTQAQIEAVKNMLEHYLNCYLNCYDGNKDQLAIEVEGLIAADAEVGETEINRLKVQLSLAEKSIEIFEKQRIDIESITIERCAQVAQNAMNKGNIGWQDGLDIIADIRKMKDE